MIKNYIVIFATLLFSATIAFASDDSWTGPDKAKHLGISFALGFAASQIPELPNRGMAFGLAMIPGVMKEYVFDGKPSFKDLTADAIGAGLGVWFGWHLIYENDMMGVKYQGRF